MAVIYIETTRITFTCCAISCILTTWATYTSRIGISVLIPTFGTSITNGMFGKGIRQEGDKFIVESFILRSSVAKPEMFSNTYDK